MGRNLRGICEGNTLSAVLGPFWVDFWNMFLGDFSILVFVCRLLGWTWGRFWCLLECLGDIWGEFGSILEGVGRGSEESGLGFWSILWMFDGKKRGKASKSSEKF